MKKEILSIQGLTLSLETPEGTSDILRQLSLLVYEGEILVVLGESGAGKTLLAKAIMGLLPPQIKVTQGEMHRVFGEEAMSLVLQDPKKLLDPTMTVGRQVTEALKYAGVRKSLRKTRALTLLQEVGMADADRRFHQYVHELSGGLAQRAVLAVALAKAPRLLLADEPTTALDAGYEEKIMSLLNDLNRKNAMTILLITHSIEVARSMGHRIAVMYAGRIVEIGLAREVLETPAHPYTRALLRAASLSADEEGYLPVIPGTPPCAGSFSQGDPFAPRNPEALLMDFLEEPPLMGITETHYAATWLLDERYRRICGMERSGSDE